MSETECPVNHEERRKLGMQGCYHCRALLQTESEALAIKAAVPNLPDPVWQRWVELKLAQQERATSIVMAALNNEELMRQIRESYALEGHESAGVIVATDVLFPEGRGK